MARTLIRWTETAKSGLAKLPKKVRRGLLDKANELKDADDPRAVHKPLTGPLQGFFRICYSRYRLIFCVDEETLASGDRIQRVTITFVAAGIRKEGDKKDVYRLAEKLFKLGILTVEKKEENRG